MDSIIQLAEEVCRQMEDHRSERLFTVAVSGIDASGKGYVSKRLQEHLELKGLVVANINIDPWQNPIGTRLSQVNPAINVYEKIFRWQEFFDQLIFPLQQNKSIYLETTCIRTDADIYYPLLYDYPAPDVLLMEGILLFKKAYIPFYDLRIWIDCSFETGLQRAISRNSEKLPREKLIDDYQTFYYAAQRLHFEWDDPRQAADIIFHNDGPLSY